MDIITDDDGHDTILFGGGIDASDITAWRTGSTVVLSIGANDSVQFLHTSAAGFSIETVQFADGTQWSAADIIRKLNMAPTGSVTGTGTAAQNETLIAANSLADLDGLGTISYQWQASSDDGLHWANIAGATASTFTLGQAQVGATVRVVASYTDGFGAVESVASAATAAIANVNDAPTGSVSITGTATQKQVLTVSNTLADADGLGTLSYQWQASKDAGTTWSAIAGATAKTFTLGQGQVGATVRALASYKDGFGVTETVASAATAVVANINDAPTGGVAITGKAAQKQVLTAANTLADADGLGTISYQWQASKDAGRTWSAIAGATAKTFTLGQGQVGATVRAVASYKDSLGTMESVASAASAAVANVNDAPVMVRALETQFGEESQAWRYVVPAGAFVDADGDALVWSAALDSGAALPSWLTFNSTTHAFTATPTAKAAGVWSVQVKATDSSGASAVTSFSLDIARALTGSATNDVIVGTALRDIVRAGAGDDTVSGGVGNDVLYGEAGRDRLDGGAGNDTLHGEAGSDRLDGGAGNDALNGGTGNDTYVFGRGSGADLVTENDATAGNTDVASFGTGISSEQLWFAKSGNDLQVSIIGTTDTLTVSNWYLGSQYHVEQFKTADGKLLLDSQVQNLVNAMAAFAPPAAGQSNLGGSTASALAPVLAANWH